MDTILDIIQRIDARLKHLKKELVTLSGDKALICLGALKELTDLSEHLQGGVERSGPEC